jgi:hypothetical protein
MNLVRQIRVPVGGTSKDPIYDTFTVGIRSDALTEEPCEHCYGSGRKVRGGLSLNCERGIHTARCVGNTDPAKCICFCHEERGQ